MTTPDIQVDASGQMTQEGVDQSLATLRGLCGWHVYPRREETVTVDTTGDQVVFLPTKLLHNVLEVHLDGREVPADKFSFSQDGMLHFDDRVPRGFRKVTATIDHGHEDAGDFIGVVYSIAKRAARPAEGTTVGRISVSPPGVLTPQSTEWRIVDAYRLGPMP